MFTNKSREKKTNLTFLLNYTALLLMWKQSWWLCNWGKFDWL